MATQEAEVEEEIIREEAATIPAEDGLIPAEEADAEVEAIMQIHTTIHLRAFPQKKKRISSMAESAPCINDILSDDELFMILSKLELQGEKECCRLVCKRWCKVQSAQRRRLCAPPGPDRLRHLLARFTGLIELDLSQSVTRPFYRDFTDSDLDLIVYALPGLRVLNLKNCRSISDTRLDAIGVSFPLLESLDVSHCRNLTDKGFTAVVSGCLNLKRLHLTRCRLVTDSLLRTLSNCSKLEELGLASCPKITDSGLCHLSEGARRIKTIDLSKCTIVSDLGIGKIISSSGESLLSIKLLDCFNVTDVTAFAVAKSCPNLEILVLGGCCDITDQSLNAIVYSCGKNLRSLRLDGCEKLTDLSLKSVISNCENLVALDIGSCDKVTDETFWTLTENQFDSKLRVMKATHVGFTESGVRIISKFCKDMEYVDLRSCSDVSEWFPSGCSVNFGNSLSMQEMVVEQYF
ncbi:uncharacterized protein LOC144547926 [Carex rostrata]